jgi:X-X-X-Leu-X-X-Gly heptad repeat protein
VGEAEAEILDEPAFPGALGDGVGQAAGGSGRLHDGLGELPGAGEEAVGGKDLVHQAELEGLPGADGLTGIELVSRALGADELLEGE